MELCGCLCLGISKLADVLLDSRWVHILIHKDNRKSLCIPSFPDSDPNTVDAAAKVFNGVSGACGKHTIADGSTDMHKNLMLVPIIYMYAALVTQTH